MSQTEVLLVQHIDNFGSEGDVVKVRPDLLQFLLPRGKAVPLNHANKKRLDALKYPDSQRIRRLTEGHEIANKLADTTVAVAVKTGAEVSYLVP